MLPFLKEKKKFPLNAIEMHLRLHRYSTARCENVFIQCFHS